MYEQRTFFSVFIILISTVGTGSGLPNISNETCLIDNTTSLSEMDYNTTLIPKAIEWTRPANVVHTESFIFEHNDDSLEPTPIPTSQPIEYLWDKKISPIDYQQSFCPQRCLNDQVVYINDISNRCPSLTCSKCSCQKPRCELYGICCPEISEPYFPPQGLLSGLFSEFDIGFQDLVDQIEKLRRYQANSKKEVESSKFTGQLGCAFDSDSSSFYYIQSCFSTASEELIRQCQIDRRSPDITLDTITYAADNTSGSIYKNRFCAECNEAQQVVKFELILKCIHFMKLYRETDENELLRMALSEESCQITQKVPAHVGIVACDESVILTEPIGKCNQQFSFSEDIVTVCHQLQLPKYAVGRHNYLNYKNIFCAICNLGVYPEYGSCNQTIIFPTYQPPTYQPPPKLFALLLNFHNYNSGKTANEEVSLSTSNCSQSEWETPDVVFSRTSGDAMDYYHNYDVMHRNNSSEKKGHCVPLHCSDGKLLVNARCHTALPLIRGLGYHLQVWLSHQLNSREAEFFYSTLKLASELSYLEEELTSIFTPVSAGYNLFICVFLDNYTNQSDMLMTYFISGYLIADINLNRDSFEEFILGNLSELNLNAVFVPEESLVNPYCSTSHLVSVLSSDDFFSENKDIIKQSRHFLRLSPALTCSFVTFDKSQFDVTFVANNIPPRVKIIVDVNITKVNISEGKDLNMVQITEDGNLNICHEVLDREFKNIMTKKVQVSSRETGLSTVKYLLNLVLLCVSMLALTLTIITYLKFPSLQNLAGRNNIFLCFTLLLAQLFLIVGSEITTIGPVCTTIGVCIHFCWIWAFTWTFICSYSMFKVFTSKTRPSHKSNSLRLQTIKRFLISLAVPIVIIASVVIISMVTTNGNNIGYGTTSCFLDTAILTALSVVVPLAIIVIINLLFLFITIGTIYKIRKFQSLEANRKDNLKNLMIYIKLSSMTGGFWLLGIIATVIQSDIIEFMSILLNGLQGCFIFLSYICNRRVLSLYLPEQKPEKTSIVSTNMSSELKCISQ